MKQTRRFLALLLVMALLSVNLPAPVFAVGTTNADGYIEVRTVEDLYFIRNDLTANYILMNDIDLTEATKAGGDWDFMGNGWNPIGSNDVYGSSKFSGVFDGNGHKITGLRIKITTLPSGVSSPIYVGLFAYVSGTVKNLTVEGDIHGAIKNGTCYVGGIAAFTTGTISNCVNEATVYGQTSGSTNYKAYVGGIVGYGGTNAVISNCANNGAITAYANTSYAYAGGIVSSGSYATVKSCYNTAPIAVSVYGYYSSGSKSAYGYAYGIGNADKVTDCYNTASVSVSMTSSATDYYSSCYAYGIGDSNNTRCYNVGMVTGSEGNSAIGLGTNINCYYLEGTGEQTTGCTPLTAAQMKIQDMYNGFVFDERWSGDSWIVDPDISDPWGDSWVEGPWIMNPHAAYPYPQLKDNVQNLETGASLVSVISWPLKTEYMTGDELVLDGCMINVIYTSGSSEMLNVTPDMVSGFDSTKVGEQTVTVTYRGQSDSFPVTVIERPEVTDISLITLPNTTEFRVGTAFDFTGAQLRVDYSNGTMQMIPVTEDMTSGGNIHRIGKHTITVTYGGQTATFEVTVTPVALSSLRLEALPRKLTYLEGEELDLTGLTLFAVMNNGTENLVSSGYTVSGFASTPGKHTLTVQYMGKTVSFEVTVQAKTLISLVLQKAPTRKQYIAGEAFDDTGMELVATYDNGDVELVTEYELTGFDATPGQKNIVITVGGKYVSFPITVIAREITDFRITSYPVKLAYLQYEDMDLTGMEVKVTYNDGTSQLVEDYQVAGFSSEVGTHTISVAYAGWVKTFDIIVTERKMVDLEVKTPDRLTYFVGESFESDGMIVTASYNNGQRIDVIDYQVSGFDSTTEGIKTVTVSYGGMSRSFNVSVSKRSQIHTGGSFVIETATGRPGTEVRVDVQVGGNLGLAGLRHDIVFDATQLELIGAEAQGAFAAGTLILNNEQAAGGQATVLWFCGSDVESNGAVYQLIFRIKETAPDGTAKVQISFGENDNGNISGENLIFGKQDGGVQVLSYWLGDLSGDRKCAMVDLVMLAQYVAGFEMTLSEKQLLSADVNEDSTIDIHDVVLLNQWLLAEGL